MRKDAPYVSGSVAGGVGIMSMDYLGGFHYQGTALKFFPTAEGYVQATALKVGFAYSYVYNYTDHLGNIRLSYAQDPENPNVLKILEESHYYPFGLKHTNYNSDQLAFKEKDPGPGIMLMAAAAAVDPVPQFVYNYKYNGKEFQDEMGLNWYDYGARNYDPAIGRWMNIDPLAENYFSMSTYTYAGNVPTKFVDYNGKDFGISYKNGRITISQTWYNDGQTKIEDLLREAIEYLNNLNGQYAIKTENGDVIPIDFQITFGEEKGKIVDDGYFIVNSNQLLAEYDDTANFLAGAGMELRNTYNAVGRMEKGGDNTRVCSDCKSYGDKKDYNADSGVVAHEMMHALGITHEAIGKYGKQMTIDGIGGMLQYASKNSKGFNISLNNIKEGSYLTRSDVPERSDLPKVKNTSPKKVKIYGTIIKIN